MFFNVYDRTSFLSVLSADQVQMKYHYFFGDEKKICFKCSCNLFVSQTE